MAPEQPGSTAEVDEPPVEVIADSYTETDVRAPDESEATVIANGRGWGGIATDLDESSDGDAAVAAELNGASVDTDLPEPSVRKVRRGRRVKRVIRRIELWSVLKVALVLYACFYAAVMAALVVIWGFAYSAGLVNNFESFANDIGFENWQFYGESMFRQAALIGGVMVVAATVLTVLATALVNVISELTGGIRIVVIEEDTIYLPVEEEL